jgi:pimeloyl-ACP methyl ester carboxylesterase
MVLMPVGVAIGQTHMPRDPIGAPPSDRYVEVTFRSSDGLKLSGWYAPSRNRAAVIVVAGSGGDRLGSRQHAELLARHGYGVLLYDARGSGKSEGSPNGYGWGWNYDVRGAMTFLQRQPDVDSDRIGGLGLSTGADVLIRVAAEDRDLKAVVSDGATGASFDDLLPSARVATPFFWTLFTGVHLFSGTPPGPALEDLVPQVSPTPLLLIAAGSLPEEREFNAVYARVAREPFELWDLPHVNHNAAIRQVADEYEDRVIGHFDDALVDPANAQR